MPLERQPHIVYRMYDAKGNCLYVGMTSSMRYRIYDHRQKSEWFSDVKKVRLEHYPNRNRAMLARKEAIAKYNPKYNSHRSRNV